MKRFIISLLLVQTIYGMGSKYMPVVLMPGISSTAQSPEPFKRKLEAKFPGIYVKIIAPPKDGVANGWNRIEHARQQIKKDHMLMAYPHYNMICHSQGTLDGRGVIETKEDTGDNQEPAVYNYIGLSGPQAGEFGIAHTLLEEIENLLHCENPELKKIVDDYLRAELKDVYRILYQPLAQENISFASYWNDPFHQKEYLEESKFLPLLNNEKVHEHAAQYKRNIMALNTMVLMSSLREQEIKPRESSFFYFYKSGSNAVIETFHQRYNTSHDPLGLWALACQEKITFLEANCLHTEFWSDQNVFNMVARYAGILCQNQSDMQSKKCCCDLV